MSTLRQAAEAAYQHAVNDPMARLDQRQLKALRAALDAPDIADELAAALKSARELVVTYLSSTPASLTILEAVESDIRAALRRYDDSRPPA